VKCSMRLSPALRPITTPPSPAVTVTSRTLAGRVAIAFVLALVAAYKSLFSPLFAGSCRFEPSCSDYLSQAVRAHGALRGTWLGIKRLARCHPFGAAGIDPCPPRGKSR
jgi:putative membrane protein insertion efficiency factor